MKRLWILPGTPIAILLPIAAAYGSLVDESVELPDADDITETHILVTGAATCTLIHAIRLDHSPILIIRRIPDPALDFVHFLGDGMPRRIAVDQILGNVVIVVQALSLDAISLMKSSPIAIQLLSY